MKLLNIIAACLIGSVFAYITFLCGSMTFVIASGLVENVSNQGLWVGTFAAGVLTCVMSLATVGVVGLTLDTDY